MQNFRSLKVWQAAHALTLEIYQSTRSFPKEESYGITSQIRRASSSIPANIAEGACRTQAEFLNSLRIALGSASEVEYHLILAHDLGYLDDLRYTAHDKQIEEIKKMLTGLMQSIQSKPRALRDEPGAYGEN